jgi:hypothetical protein
MGIAASIPSTPLRYSSLAALVNAREGNFAKFLRICPVMTNKNAIAKSFPQSRKMPEVAKFSRNSGHVRGTSTRPLAGVEIARVFFQASRCKLLKNV